MNDRWLSQEDAMLNEKRDYAGWSQLFSSRLDFNLNNFTSLNDLRFGWNVILRKRQLNNRPDNSLSKW